MVHCKIKVEKYQKIGADEELRGQPLERKFLDKIFSTREEALSFAYEIVNKSDKKAKNQYTKRIVYDVYMEVNGGKIRVRVFVRNGKIYVLMWKNYGEGDAYQLNRNGTVNRRAKLRRD